MRSPNFLISLLDEKASSTRLRLNSVQTQLALEPFVPTRWTVRASSFDSVLSNYEILMSVWDEALDIAPDSESHARIMGVQHVMSTFEYLFGVMVGRIILGHTDNLSETLQNPSLSVSEGMVIVDLTRKTLASLCTDANFDLFWWKAVSQQDKFGVRDPVLPRKRKVPTRYSIGQKKLSSAMN